MTRWANRGGIKVLTGRERCICGEIAVRGTCSAWLRKWTPKPEPTPEKRRTRTDFLIDGMYDLGFNPDRPRTAQYRQFAPLLGSTPSALEKAYSRSLKAKAAA